MIMSASPGILDGDAYDIKLILAEQSHVHLTTQSYQRLFTMTRQAAQHFEAHLAPHTTLIYLPHPLVPHVLSSFSAQNHIFLSTHCTLIWSDILTCGRKLTGEIFKFTKLHSMTQVYLNNRLVIKENILLEPATMCLEAIGQLEGFSHQGSLIYINELADVGKLTKEIHAFLSREADILFGISELPINGLIVRILGQKAEQLYDSIKTLASILVPY